ncbi:hypothetical protein [Clostridium perfringens]|uniref:hypothetical protein n=1 Tax=Clostridium perfringens TaxID=1502 RepID=UPI003755136D
MNEIKKNVLESIANGIREQETLAYFEVVCYEVFGEMNKENSEKLQVVLDELLNENRITIDGDRIGLTESSIIFIDENLDGSDLNGLEKTGLSFKKISTDIGHGCGIPAIGLILQDGFFNGILMLATGGLVLAKVKEIVEGYEWTYNRLKEFFGKSKEIFYNNDVIIASVLSKIYNDYKKQDIEISNIKLVSNAEIKVGAEGLYSEEHYNFRSMSVESAPNRIIFLAFEVWSDEFTYDYDLITVEINSKMELLTHNKLSVDL